MVVYTFELGTWRDVQKDQRAEVSYTGRPCLKQRSKQTKHPNMFLLLLPQVFARED